MSRTAAADHVLEEIAGKRDALVTLTRELIRIPTVNPPGDAYAPCAELLGERLRRQGFAIAYLRAVGTPGDSDRHPRLNMVARRELGGRGRCLHFNGHIDVVTVGRGWTVEPFAGTVRDGRVYGRGACDMKGGIAASVIAVETLCELCPNLPGTLEISATVDEESGGFGGVAWLAERGFFAPPRVHHVIIPEPLNVDRVCVGHRGVWWVEVETQGRIAHGSMPFLGDCAIGHMAAFLHRVEMELLPALQRRRTRMPVVPPAARHATLNINAVHGGEAEGHGGLPSPCVADSCRAVLDRRYLVEEDRAEVKAEIGRLLEACAAERPGFRWRLRDIMEFAPVMTDPEAPVPRAVAAAIRRVLGRPAEIVASPGTYDQKHIMRVGRLEDCVAYGPGILDLAHQPDEYVEIDALVASAQVMALAALELLGQGR